MSSLHCWAFVCMAKWLRKWRRGWLYVRSNTKNAKSLFIQNVHFCLHCYLHMIHGCILKRGLTLIHPHSRNKSDEYDLFIFFLLVLKWNIKGNKCEKGMSSIFNSSLSFIVPVRLTFNQKKKKSGLRSQTYSWTKVIHLSRIRNIVTFFWRRKS